MNNIKTLAFLLILSLATSVYAQNSYKLKDTNVSFSTPEQLNVVSDKLGYAVFSNSGIQVTLTQIRFLAVGGLEKELNKYFSNNEYTLTQTNNFSRSDSQYGTFHFANRRGSRLRYAKGLIVDGEKTILVEIEYDPSKENQVNELVHSFCAQSTKSSTEPEATANLDSNDEEEEDEYIQKYDYTKYIQIEEATPVMVESEDLPKTEKHPKVEHPNLIKLTQSQKQEFIDAHNKWRKDVGVPPLTWSDDLENYAGEWAIINGKKNCKMQHRDDTDYGENLYWSSGMTFSPRGAVDSWGSEIDDYNDELIGQEKAVVGHYTQIVWRTTTEVGCAAFQCGSALLVVCNYNPAGNWVGQHPYK